MSDQPKGHLSLRTLAMPADANPNGDIFGGWLISQMDIAAGMTASQRSRGRAATVAINGMTFKLPVYIGDILCVYTEIVEVRTTSMKIYVEAWVIRERKSERIKVTEGMFTFVAIDNNRKPRPISDQ